METPWGGDERATEGVTRRVVVVEPGDREVILAEGEDARRRRSWVFFFHERKLGMVSRKREEEREGWGEVEGSGQHLGW